MKKILLVFFSIILIAGTVFSQRRYYRIESSPEKGNLLQGKMDSVAVNISFRSRQLVGYFDVWAQIDTARGDSCSGKIPRIRGEWAYLNSFGDTLKSVDSSKTWFVFTDSIADVDSVYQFRWEPKFSDGAVIRWIMDDSAGQSNGRDVYLRWGVEAQ